MYVCKNGGKTATATEEDDSQIATRVDPYSVH